METGRETEESIRVLIVSEPTYDTRHIQDVLSCDRFVVSWLSICQGYQLENNTDDYDVILIANEEIWQAEFEFLVSVRSYSTIPVLMIVYEYSIAQCNRCFEQGGDDYVAGPKHLEELPSRIVATLRRSQRVSIAISRNELMFDELYLNRPKALAKVGGKAVELTSIQFSLLWLLATYRKQVLDKPFLYKSVLERDYSQHDRSLDMHMSRIRKKLVEAGLQPERLKTVHGTGYSLAY